MMLDHQAGIATVDGTTRFEAPAVRPRLEQHYCTLLARTLGGDPVFTPEQDLALHDLLFAYFV
jgi:hypothetical protein